jgi:hypothetical protein
LASRVDDAQVRGWMAELIEVGKPVLTEPVLERTLEINVKLNERVGRLIRGESP